MYTWIEMRSRYHYDKLSNELKSLQNVRKPMGRIFFGNRMTVISGNDNYYTYTKILTEI